MELHVRGILTKTGPGECYMMERVQPRMRICIFPHESHRHKTRKTKNEQKERGKKG